MKRYLLLLVIIHFFGSGFAQRHIYDSKWINDTIDFSSCRLFLSAPAMSVKNSILYISKGDGTGVFFPLDLVTNSDSTVNLYALNIDCYVNTTYSRYIDNDSVDIELWNTFNRNFVGSRSYIVDGLYTRIDVLNPFIVLYYEALPKTIALIADKIISSVYTRSNRDQPIQRKRREGYVGERIYFLLKNDED